MWNMFSRDDFKGLFGYLDEQFFYAIIQFAEELKFFLIAFFAGLISFYELTSVEISFLVLTLFRQVPIRVSNVIFEIVDNFLAQYKIEISKTYAKISMAYGLFVLGVLLFIANYLKPLFFMAFSNKDQKDPLIYRQEQDIVQGINETTILFVFFSISENVRIILLGVMKAMRREKLASLFIFFSFYMIGFPLSLFLYLHHDFTSKSLWFGYSIASVTLNILFSWIALSANLHSICEKISREKENEKEIELTNENLVTKL